METLVKMFVATVAVAVAYVLCNIAVVALVVLLVKVFG